MDASILVFHKSIAIRRVEMKYQKNDLSELYVYTVVATACSIAGVCG